jgi:uncharacterized membrane protein
MFEMAIPWIAGFLVIAILFVIIAFAVRFRNAKLSARRNKNNN